MASAIMTDCSSTRGSITSSSSDAITLTTAASSWCAIPICSRIRYVRLIRPHTRRILIAPGVTPSFGFTIRGGKEYGTGFFVSNVDRNSEAQQKGLRIGDQILSINGFNVDDAIHKEFIQLVNKQERLTLKVRSVGMLPVKDEENGGFFWSAAHNSSVSSTPSESSYQSSSTATSTGRDRHNLHERDVNIILNVAPRTKLGLGICKGPDWKPGIFVQFTKERSVAREAGLRPGDQILSVNSIDFADVLFSEAVAVMKSTNKLDIMIRKGVGCDLFPTESSGYNSSASSVTGDQSPCWADIKSKRLTSVREEIGAVMPSKQDCNNKLSDNKQQETKLEEVEGGSPNSSSNCKVVNKEINKTIIKLSETGVCINNSHADGGAASSALHLNKRESLRDATINLNSRSTAPPPPPPPPPPSSLLSPLKSPLPCNTIVPSNANECKSSCLYNETKCNGMKQESLRNCGNGLKLGGIAATMQRYQNIRQAKVNGTIPSNLRQVTNNFRSSLMKTEPDNFTSLSDAIAEELKKRKTKQENPALIPTEMTAVKQTISRSVSANSQYTENAYCVSPQHNNFISEFKEAHKRIFKNGLNSIESKETVTPEVGPSLQHSVTHASNVYSFTENVKPSITKCPTDTSSNYGCIQLRHKANHNINSDPAVVSNGKQSNRLSNETTNRSLNVTLSNELESTLSRLKLKKTQNSYKEHHQNHCLNQQSSDHVISDNIRKDQSQIYSNLCNTERSNANKFQTATVNNGAIGVSILKNGNRSNTNTTMKSIEKSIKFG